MSRGQVGCTVEGAAFSEYSSIRQAIYGQAVKLTGRFNDWTQLEELQTQKRRRLHNHSLAEPRFCNSRDPSRVTQAAVALAVFVVAFCNQPVAVTTLATTLRGPPWLSQRLLASKRRDILHLY
jgi:hypothetical protein